MVRLTEDSIRKKAEHNDGILADLEEISLHQMEIEKIENIHILCPKLKILYLQNNIIDRMENMYRLRCLNYLNLAMNNIILIEGIENCEDLNKLDLTLNFIDLENLAESIENLQANANLRQLYLTGNPCMDWPRSREYIIASLPSLQQLDGKDIAPSERLRAIRQLSSLERELSVLAEQNKEDRINERGFYAPPKTEGSYNRESRKQMYQELAAEKEAKEARKRDPPPPEKEVTPIYNARGEVRQCNEGKYRYAFDDADDSILKLEIFVPRFLDTSQIDIDVHPTFVRCVVRGKVTQLKMFDEVQVDSSKVQRSKATGSLLVSMPRVEKRAPGAGRSYLTPEEQLELADGVPLQVILDRHEKERIAKEAQAKKKPASKGVDIFKNGMNDVTADRGFKVNVERRVERLVDTDEDSDDDGPPPLEKVF